MADALKGELAFAAMGKLHDGSERVKGHNGTDERSSKESTKGPLVGSGNTIADLELGVSAS